MKSKGGSLLLIILLITASAGCLEKNETGAKNGSIEGNISGEKTIGLNVSTHTQRMKPNVDLGKIIDGIRTYSYHQETVVKLKVTTIRDNLTMRTNASVITREDGYVDMVDKKAMANSTVTVLPDNITESMLQVVIGNRTYVKTKFGVNVIEVATIWDFHPLRIVKEAIKGKPLAKYTENGTTVILYSPPKGLLLPMTRAYLGIGPNLTVTDAVLEVRITNGAISQIRLLYSLLARGSSDDATGHIEIVEAGTWESLVRITSVNEKRSVKPLT